MFITCNGKESLIHEEHEAVVKPGMAKNKPYNFNWLKFQKVELLWWIFNGLNWCGFSKPAFIYFLFPNFRQADRNPTPFGCETENRIHFHNHHHDILALGATVTLLSFSSICFHYLVSELVFLDLSASLRSTPGAVEMDCQLELHTDNIPTYDIPPSFISSTILTFNDTFINIARKFQIF